MKTIKYLDKHTVDGKEIYKGLTVYDTQYEKGDEFYRNIVRDIQVEEDGKISVMFKSAGKLGRQIPNISVLTNYKRKIKLELKGFVDAERAKPAKVIKAPVEDSTEAKQ